MASLVLLYFGGALIGAVWVRNSDFEPAEKGVRVWVSCSDIHADIVLPPPTRWEDRFGLGPRDRYLAVGWGDKRFYLETPTWSDVKITNVLTAFFGLDETAMHVQRLGAAPVENENCRVLVLTQAQYDLLCEQVESSFSVDAYGRPVLLASPGYSDSDAFYEAEGRYNVFQTCNTWVGRTLGEAGVRVGIWTPLPWGVLWQL